MRLALINHNAEAKCAVCTWSWRCPSKRKKKGQPDQILSSEERFKILEQNVLAHLRDAHDRILVTKEEFPPGEDDQIKRAHYNGQRIQGVKWTSLRLNQ